MKVGTGVGFFLFLRDRLQFILQGRKKKEEKDTGEDGEQKLLGKEEKKNPRIEGETTC